LILIAHRANTVAAIEAAAAAGADAVELDVRRRDGALVLAHDADEPAGALLEEGLARARELGLDAQLDVKEAGLEAEAAAARRRAGVAGFVSSPSLGVLRAFAAADPSLPRAFTYPEDRHSLTRLPAPLVAAGLAGVRAVVPVRLPPLLRAARAAAATVNVNVFSPRLVSACRRSGVKVYVWTVNDPDRARTLVEAGADAIISDDPRIVLGGISKS
jgi:glycerophosphoryl diester phosphodiesterase